MMRTDYVEAHFCVQCLRETEHVLFTYLNQGTLTCQFCQHTEVVEKEAEQPMKRTYTIVSIDEKDRNSPKRRMVVVEIQRKSEPDSLGETKSSVDYLKVQFPAYGEEYYFATVAEYPSGRSINFVEAKAIAEEIKKFTGR